jgi:hypothetical protein
MSVAEPQPAVLKPSVRWHHPTPDRLIVGLLAVEGLLWLSDHLGWPAWHKGYAVLAAVATVAVALLAMSLWFALALFFRWRFQFSIRSLLVLVVVVAVPCDWLEVEVEWAREQREAREAIVRLGGRGGYDVYIHQSGNSVPPGPPWLRNLLGEDFFVTVAEVTFTNSSSVTDDITDTGLKYIEGLTQLYSLSLIGTRITDAGLQHLKRLTQLRILSLIGTRITDTGLQHLEGLTHLQELYLDGTKITDAGLQHVKGLTQLRTLGLTGTKVTDESVEKLQQALPNCRIHH